MDAQGYSRFLFTDIFQRWYACRRSLTWRPLEGGSQLRRNYWRLRRRDESQSPGTWSQEYLLLERNRTRRIGYKRRRLWLCQRHERALGIYSHASASHV